MVAWAWALSRIVTSTTHSLARGKNGQRKDNTMELVFVGSDTDTVEDGSQGVVFDLAATGYVADGDTYFDEVRIINLSEKHGVPLADLWSAYQWRESLLRAGVLAEVERMVGRVTA